jgi:hypothetical protein
MNHADQIAIISAKLQSMIEMTYGHAGEAFRGMTDELQDAFLSQAACLAAEAVTLARGMTQQ